MDRGAGQAIVHGGHKESDMTVQHGTNPRLVGETSRQGKSDGWHKCREARRRRFC